MIHLNTVSKAYPTFRMYVERAADQRLPASLRIGFSDRAEGFLQALVDNSLLSNTSRLSILAELAELCRPL